MQSALEKALHVALILDGNGRWATQKGWPRVAGHRAGAKVVRDIVEVAPDCGVGILTLYAFSSDNWKRPKHEVEVLMRLFKEYLRSETRRCIRNGVRLSIIGRRDRLPQHLVQTIEKSEAQTVLGTHLHLRVALDYSARDMLLQATVDLQQAGLAPTRENLERFSTHPSGEMEAVPDVDLVIRTGGEQRLSDFLLWESAYAELFFLEKMWPDFNQDDLQAVISDFYHRDRRFGGLNLEEAV